jgi:3-oxosteroid 1-dehydrogenase
MTRWDESVDWLVVGSGAAGMTSALRASDLGMRTLVVEKSAKYGGSTAMSGGAIWVPNHPLLARTRVRDSRAEGLVYLEHITRGRTPRASLEAYLDGAPRMVEYLARGSWVEFEPVQGYADYYPEAPGGKPGARTIEPPAFEALRLGDDRVHQQPAFEHARALPFLSFKASEVRPMLTGGWPRLAIFGRQFAGYYLNVRARLQRAGNTRYTLGASLAARLRLSLRDRNVPVWLSSPLRDLVVESGRVRGAIVEREGRTLAIEARRGVLLAAGGFEHNAEMRRRYQRAPVGSDWAAGCEANTGDAIRIAESIGAALDLMDDAWWCPVFKVPDEPIPRVIVMEKGLPGSILVNQAGRRFLNESTPYNDFVKATYAAHHTGVSAIPAHLIFDATFRRRYPVGPVRPGSTQPDSMLAPPILDGFLVRAPTLVDLAHKIGVDPTGLEASVSRFNAQARRGKDDDFHRGESLTDRYYSDPHVKPNSCLAPVERPPFYAVKVYPGDLGTKGGVRIDAHACAQSTSGEPIPGLFAAGNSSASVMGDTYPGAGGTIGPAMTFGFLAAERAFGAADEAHASR